MNILKSITSIAIFILSHTAVHSEIAKKIPDSVWVWQASSANRIVYLIGEHHQFMISANEPNVTHKLGESVYLASNKVYIENKQRNIANYNLSSYLNDSIVEGMKSAIIKFTHIISKKNESEKKILAEQQIIEILQNSPFFAYVNLTFLNTLNYIINSNYNLMNSNGLILVLKEKEKYFPLNHAKLVPIESENAIFQDWNANCNSKENASTLIESALINMNTNKKFTDSNISKAQSIFLNEFSTIDDVMHNLLNTQEGMIISKCIISPRNINWIKNLKPELSTAGPNIAIVAGIAHMGGENGLIALLRKEGFNDIKRIYDVK